MKDLIKKRLAAKESIIETGEMILNQLKPIIESVLNEKIVAQLGWEEAGIETLVFECDRKSILYKLDNKPKGLVSLESVFDEIEEFKGISFECPFGLYITKKEKKLIKEKIKSIIY